MTVGNVFVNDTVRIKVKFVDIDSVTGDQVDVYPISVSVRIFKADETEIVSTTASSLSASEFENNGFSFYPNPAKGSFNIKSNASNLATKIDVFDLTGKLLFSKKLDANPENSIDTNLLSKGMYLVYVEATDGTNFSTKLVIE